MNPIEATTRDRDALTVTAVILALLAFFGAAVAVGLSVDSDKNASVEAAVSAGAAAGAGPVEVELSEFAVSPKKVEAAAGRAVLHVVNTGSTPHNLSVVGEGLATPMLAAGEDATLDVSGLAAAGTWRCRPTRWTRPCTTARLRSRRRRRARAPSRWRPVSRTG